MNLTFPLTLEEMLNISFEHDDERVSELFKIYPRGAFKAQKNDILKNVLRCNTTQVNFYASVLYNYFFTDEGDKLPFSCFSTIRLKMIPGTPKDIIMSLIYHGNKIYGLESTLSWDEYVKKYPTYYHTRYGFCIHQPHLFIYNIEKVPYQFINEMNEDLWLWHKKKHLMKWETKKLPKVIVHLLHHTNLESLLDPSDILDTKVALTHLGTLTPRDMNIDFFKMWVHHPSHKEKEKIIQHWFVHAVFYDKDELLQEIYDACPIEAMFLKMCENSIRQCTSLAECFSLLKNHNAFDYEESELMID